MQNIGMFMHVIGFVMQPIGMNLTGYWNLRNLLVGSFRFFFSFMPAIGKLMQGIGRFMQILAGSFRLMRVT